ncbi:MAG: TlpA family protein disulfide reductase [Bacteroidota bacterium]|nr:TlpA family protein disulfide reductase [Bacteroidota bacterium]
MIKNIVFGLGVVFIFFSCSQRKSNGSGEAKDTITISGKVNFPQDGFIVLEEIGENKPISIDTVRLNSDSSFFLEVRNTEPGYYRLNFFNKQFVNLILNKEDVSMVVDGHTQNGLAEVNGSTDTDFYNVINNIMHNFQAKVNPLQNEYVKAKNKGNEKKMAEIENLFLEYQSENTRLIKSEIRDMKHSIAALYAVNYLNTEEEFPFLDSLASEIKVKLPHSKYVNKFVEQVEGMKAISIGQVAPDIVLPNTEGKEVKLSSLRGNYVLIDFWAAWCRPCRMENPNVVRLYNEYNQKGFEVFGVSLDRKKEDWVEAIQKDKLTWTQVSDLSYFNSKAAELYKVNAIPATFLLDKEGKIIGKNLRGKDLEDKLKEIFG